MRFTEAFSAALSERLLQAYRKPLGFLLGLVLFPLALMAVVTYRLGVQGQERQAFHHLGVTAHLAAEIVDETLAHTVQLERVLAAQPGFAQALLDRNAAWLGTRLTEALAFSPRISALSVLTPEGTVLATAPEAPARLGQSLGDTNALAALRRNAQQPYVSAVYFEEQPKPRKVVNIYCPLMAGERVIGILQAEHEVEAVKSWLQKIRVEPDGFVYVVDHQQQLVVYPFQVLPGRPKVVADWPTVRPPLPAGGGTLRFRDSRGREWLAGLYPLPALGWRVVAVQPRASALKIFDQAVRAMGLLLGLLALVLVVVSLWWARLQASSLQLLRQNTKLLKEMQQRMLLERRKRPPEPPAAGGSP